MHKLNEKYKRYKIAYKKARDSEKELMKKLDMVWLHSEQVHAHSEANNSTRWRQISNLDGDALPEYENFVSLGTHNPSCKPRYQVTPHTYLNSDYGASETKSSNKGTAIDLHSEDLNGIDLQSHHELDEHMELPNLGEQELPHDKSGITGISAIDPNPVWMIPMKENKMPVVDSDDENRALRQRIYET